MKTIPKNQKKERTVLIIKPDGVKRGLIGEIVKRIEQRELKIIALEMFTPTKKQIDGHYPKDEKWISRLGEKTLIAFDKHGFDPIQEFGTKNTNIIGKQVRGWLIEYMIAGPIVKMIIEGAYAVDMVRKLIGATMPHDAALGTIRGDFSIDSGTVANLEKRVVSNLVHSSETKEEAKHEVKFWFGK
jgi:nucleoside-diphosphate kinase